MSSGTVTQPPAAWKTGPEGSGTRGGGGGRRQKPTGGARAFLLAFRLRPCDESLVSGHCALTK